ncbi:MAG: sigma 54-interacting transcriptional regulator [Bryobacteraceae bacterium]|jgi:transcriptional regulator with GAF, ATPase, and Fis domain
MDLIKTQLSESVFAGGGEMGVRMRALDWSATTLGPLDHWPQSLRTCVGVMLGSGYPMLVCWGPAYTMLYNDPYRPLIGTKHPAALGCPIQEVLPETWDFLGPRFDRVMADGQEASHLTGQMFTVYRNNYLEECYFSFSYSPIRDDDGAVGGVFTTVLDMTERVIEDRRRQVLRDLASRTAEARHEKDVWRVSAETFAQHRSTVPFAFLYEYLPVEHQARLVRVSAETDDDLHPTVIDCDRESIWQFHTALSEDCLVMGLGERASSSGNGALSIPGWPLPAREAAVVPIRLREHSEATAFVVLGIHPGRAFDDAYREFVRRIAEQIAIGLAAEREERLRMEAELERQRLNASQELLRETTRHYQELQEREAEIRALKDRLQRENLALRDEVDRVSMFEEIVGSSNTLQTVLSRVAKVAPTDSTVLISGETGTGKELIARAVHKRSQRSGRAFVSVNCAALAPGLISSELFGHEKGSFTGAMQRRVGRFELADGGTIFLDEVGDIPPDTQVALLRVLQERQFERVGGTLPIDVDVRVIAATHRDLRTAIADGRFREDLYYRLNVFPIEMPPLRERKDDILMLVEYFVQRYAKKAGKSIRTIEKKTLERLQAYNWPGNIRELQNVIERSVILSSGDVFSVDDVWLSHESAQVTSRVATSVPSEGEPRTERAIIEAALAASRGRVSGPSGAAAKLRIPPSTLEHKIRALKIHKSRFKFG